jgi:hypothetical protein
MVFTCASCKKAFSGRPRQSITGRSLCLACDDKLNGLATGVTAAQHRGQSLPDQVGTAISVRGWYRRLTSRRQHNARPLDL